MAVSVKPLVRAASTRYGKSVHAVPIKPAQSSGLFVLKSAENNAKIGKQLEKGRWKGLRIFTLTLEERRTCWPGCQNWERCYGDNMPFAARYRPGAELEAAIESDIEKLASSRRTARGFLVRLHVLGDFYSVPYVWFWQRMVDLHEALHIYGYTHWRHADAIGSAVTQLVLQNQKRVAILRSDRTEPDDPLPDASTVGRGERAKPGAVLCPEQSGRTASCSTCGLCMTGRTSVSFIDHSRGSRQLPIVG